ncbi:MAG: DNA polymerase III subunit delta [Nitrospiraceae bacterium]|nr:MAG: DNA polymerase III subunit delta [Nitrospiraceae bacterium]
MLNKTLLGEIDRGLPGSLYYIWSEESCFLEDALSRFIDVVISSHPADFNYDTFDSSAPVQEIINSAWTLPFMAPRRLVVIKDFQEFKAPAINTLKKYLDSPSDTTCLLILSRKGARATLKVKWKSISLNIKEWEIPAWLKQAAASRGLKLSNDAVDTLIEFVGNEVGMLSMELEKLALSGKKTLTGEDITASTGMMRKYTTFDLIDSIIAGSKARAFRILKTMSGVSTMEAPVILGTLNWHYKQFYALWLNKGKRPARMREKTFRGLNKYLASYNEDIFFNIFKDLHEADVGVKTSGRPELVIEVLLIKLLQKRRSN